MNTVTDLTRLLRPLPASVLTMGNFDGVHVGHRELLAQLVEKAKHLRLPSVVVTFDPHPSLILRPAQPVPRIFSQNDLAHALTQIGIDHFVILPFTRELSKFSAEQFLREIILPNFHPKEIVVGYDFAFGRDRGGTFDVLEKLSEAFQFHVTKVGPVIVAEEPVSSTRIRQFLSAGQMEPIAQLLGRPFYLEGEVVHGDGRGGPMGYATANLQTAAEILPATGVYVTRLYTADAIYSAVTNVGHRPTFHNDAKVSIETHVLDHSDLNLYGQSVRLEFLLRLRSELKFNSSHELIEQIKKDVAAAKKYFGK